MERGAYTASSFDRKETDGAKQPLRKVKDKWTDRQQSAKAMNKRRPR